MLKATLRSRAIFILVLAVANSDALAAKPMKVFILAGQSNMEGHAKIETFGYIGDDPATAPLLEKMQNAEGQPIECEGVWISYLTGSGEANGEGFGKLTAGYGSRRNPSQNGGKIGPEFTLGIAMDAAYDEPVLIIKTAWGGKSLFYDFRPPSAGVYEQSEQDIEKDRNRPEKSGHYYRLMIDHVRTVLANPGRVCPEYDATAGYEIAGFVWFQGWNDMVNRDIYPEVRSTDANRFAKYTEWMSEFIEDVRMDLNCPELPFVIGVMGVGGENPNPSNQAFREAMAATANLPGLKNVAAVPTAPFWDEALGAIDAKYDQVRQMAYFLRTRHKDHANHNGSLDEAAQKAYVARFESETISADEVALRARGASNAGYHYLGCAKTFALMGQAFAEQLLRMQER